jgi:hypothetical protein
MGVGIAVALDREVEGVSPDDFEGHAINQARWELSEAAEEAGLQPLDEFVSLSPEESEILASDLNFDADVDAVTPAGWFDARTGLRLVQTLLGIVAEDPDAFPGEDRLVAELTELEAVLSAAVHAGARFRLSVAY